jgi:hypothetical protein
MYPGPSCPDRPFSAELDDMEIDPRIWGVLAHGANKKFGIGTVPLSKGVVNPWVSLFELTFVCLCQFQLLKAYTFLRKILGTRAAPQGGSPYRRMW